MAEPEQQTPLPTALARCLTVAGQGQGASRVRQLAWVVRELSTYAGLPERPRSPEGWFHPSFVAGYLHEADSGALRQRGAARPSPDSTRRVRRTCLRLLAAAAGLPDPVPDGVALPALRPRVEEQVGSRAVRHWRARALPVDAPAGEVRTAAMAVLVWEAGLRSGELASLQPTDLDLDAGTVTFRPRPPAARSLPPPCTAPLSPPAVATLRRWLGVRTELTAQTPRTRTLWVSLAANHDGSGARRPAGMPLQPTGLRRAHARAVAALNAQLAGPDWEPLPRTVGQLRPVRD